MSANNKIPKTLPPRPRKSPKIGLFASIRNKILLGILLILPFIATVWIFKFLLSITTSWFPKEKLAPYLGHWGNDFLIQLLVLITILFIFFLLGTFASTWLGGKLKGLLDWIFKKIPFIQPIYSFAKQVCDWVANTQSNTMGESVVLIEYPRKGLYAIGFVTSRTQPSLVSTITGDPEAREGFANVFIPTTPNPTSGVYLMVPDSEMIPLDLDVTEAVNLIMSAGAVPPTKDKPRENA